MDNEKKNIELPADLLKIKEVINKNLTLMNDYYEMLGKLFESEIKKNKEAEALKNPPKEE